MDEDNAAKDITILDKDQPSNTLGRGNPDATVQELVAEYRGREAVAEMLKRFSQFAAALPKRSLVNLKQRIQKRRQRAALGENNQQAKA